MLECIVRSFFFELGNCGLVRTRDLLAAISFFSSTGWLWSITSFTVDAAMLTCE
jgi:hypothetical protein